MPSMPLWSIRAAPHYQTFLALTYIVARAEIQCLPCKQRMVIRSAEFGGKQSHEIWPTLHSLYKTHLIQSTAPSVSKIEVSGYGRGDVITSRSLHAITPRSLHPLKWLAPVERPDDRQVVTSRNSTRMSPLSPTLFSVIGQGSTLFLSQSRAISLKVFVITEESASVL